MLIFLNICSALTHLIYDVTGTSCGIMELFRGQNFKDKIEISLTRCFTIKKINF